MVDRAAGPQPHPIKMRPPPHRPQGGLSSDLFLNKETWLDGEWLGIPKSGET